MFWGVVLGGNVKIPYNIFQGSFALQVCPTYLAIPIPPPSYLWIWQMVCNMIWGWGTERGVNTCCGVKVSISRSDNNSERNWIEFRQFMTKILHNRRMQPEGPQKMVSKGKAQPSRLQKKNMAKKGKKWLKKANFVNEFPTGLLWGGGLTKAFSSKGLLCYWNSFLKGTFFAYLPTV